MAEDKAEGIDLDELQKEIEKLVALLEDRQPGMLMWNLFMHERLTNLHAMLHRACEPKFIK